MLRVLGWSVDILCAEHRERVAETRSVATEARSELPIHPELGTLLAAEVVARSVGVGETPEPMAEQVLRDGLGRYQGSCRLSHRVWIAHRLLLL